MARDFVEYALDSEEVSQCIRSASQLCMSGDGRVFKAGAGFFIILSSCPPGCSSDKATTAQDADNCRSRRCVSHRIYYYEYHHGVRFPPTSRYRAPCLYLCTSTQYTRVSTSANRIPSNRIPSKKRAALGYLFWDTVFGALGPVFADGPPSFFYARCTAQHTGSPKRGMGGGSGTNLTQHNVAPGRVMPNTAVPAPAYC